MPDSPAAREFAATFAAAMADDDYALASDGFSRDWPLIAPVAGGVIRELLDSVEPSLWQEEPWLITAYGASYRSLDTPGVAAAIPYFRAAQAAISPTTPDEIRIAVAVHHAAALRSIGHIDDAAAMAARAAALAETQIGITLPSRITLGAQSAVQLGIAEYLRGDFDAAIDNLTLASGLADKCLASELVECFSALAMAEYSMGKFANSATWSARARNAAGDSGLLRSRFGAAALIAELLVAVEQNRLADANALAPTVAAACRGSEWEPFGFYAQAAISIISGEYVVGLELLRDCVQAYRSWHPHGPIATMSEGLRATLLLRLGEKDSAWDILGSLAPTQHHANCPARFMAHLRFVSGDSRGTLDALVECERLGDTHSSRSLVDVQLLKAAACLDLGSLAASDVAFDRTLALAARNDMRVPFRLVPGSVMSMLLDRANGRPQSAAVADMLAHVQGVGPELASGMPQLSAREREIIRLATQDLSVSEISDQLFISVNTVKSHLKSIYRKLGVTSRAEARQRSRELGLHVQSTPG